MFDIARAIGWTLGLLLGLAGMSGNNWQTIAVGAAAMLSAALWKWSPEEEVEVVVRGRRAESE